MNYRILLFILLILALQLLPAIAKVQWASKIIGFSSEFGTKQYSAAQVLGKPSVIPGFNVSPCSWAPEFKSDSAKEWISVEFNNPTQAARIAISENNISGGVREVFLIDTSGKEYRIYLAEPIFNKPAGKMLNIAFPKTNYLVKSVKITLNYIIPKYIYQIDAIGISDADSPINAEVSLSLNADFASLPENPGKNVNSVYSELFPVISAQGDILYFTRSEHPSNKGINRRNDIWFSKINEEGKFDNSNNIGAPINNEYSNFAFSVTQDGNGLLIGNRYNRAGRMSKGVSISFKTKNGWSFPDSIIIRDFSNLNANAGYFLASSGKELILSIEMEDSRGGTDLYVSRLQEDGTWSKPTNLGDDVNTAADESTPFLASDGITLYFSTKGYCGYGNNDIFITRRKDTTWNNWQEPSNLGNVINSKHWEGYFTIPASGDYAYFVSEKNSIGAEDIFRIKIPDGLRPKTVLLVKGRVLNKKTGLPVEAGIIYELLPSGVEAGVARSNQITGEYSIVLPAGDKYGFLARVEGYIPINENLDLREDTVYRVINKDLMLVPMEVGQVIRINNIFFEFGKYDLLEDSFSELKRVIKLLQENQGIKIEISGHTDNLGSSKINLALSRDRAKAVAKYLTDGGIDKKRLLVKGNGQDNPVVPNDNEENRQLNRRVEFKILEK